jgi:TIGR03009 family protein
MSQLMLMALAIPFAAAPVDAKPEADARLDEVLREWAKASDAVKEAHFKIRVTQRDTTTEKTSTSSVEVFVRKPDLMRLDHKNEKGDRDWIVYKERIVRWLTSADKADRSYPLSEHFGFPEHPERYPDDFFSRMGGGILEQISWLAFGLPVRDLKMRFDLRLSKEDDNYLYIEIKPRNNKDCADFEQMRVVLNRKTYQVRQIWKDDAVRETTYDYERPNEDSAKPITPDSILKGLPHDYKKVSLP